MADKKEINMEIGANIRRARERAGMTQERLSEKMQLGVKSLSAIERGVVGVSLTTLKKLCVLLSVSSDSLLFGNMERNDVQELTAKLERLTPKQFEIANDIFNSLLESFALGNDEQNKPPCKMSE